MKANLIVCGVMQEEPIEIGSDSIIGRLLAGNLGGAMSKLAEIEAEINEIGGEGTCTTSIEEGA